MPAVRATSDGLDGARALGVVYTPRAVAEPMVRVALDPLARGRTATEILALRVCDPAIGEGAFLFEVVRVLAEHLEAAWAAGDSSAPASPRTTWEAEAQRRVTALCIAGVDIDARAVATARAALGAGGDALRVADALTLDWAGAFPDVFARGGFDAVVGNPPYIRQEKIANKRALEKFACYDGVADLYVYFVELAHRLVHPHGRYCLIVPTKWMSAAYGRKLRGFLAAQGSIEGLVDLSRAPLFQDAEAFPCILWAARDTGDQPIRAARPDTGVSVEDSLDAKGVPHTRARWGAGPWHIDTLDDRALIDRLEHRWPRLGDVLPDRPSRGVVTGCNRAFVIDRATHDRILADEPAAGVLMRPFVKGRDIRPWTATEIERWIVLVDRGTSLDQLPVVRAHLAAFRAALEPRPLTWRGAWTGRKPGSYAWYELQDPVVPLAKSRSPRLLYQDIQTSPACCLDSGELVPDTTVWILPTDDRFLLGLLNSPLYGWYAQRRFPPALNGAVRPKLEYIRSLPIATPSPDARRAIEQLVDARLALEPRANAGELDAVIGRAIMEIYELSAQERQLIGT